jgi:L-lactate dehydrogenase complex protein LldG
MEEDLLRLARPEDDLLALFVLRAAEVGAIVRVTAPARLAAEIVEVLESEKSREVVTTLDGIAGAETLIEEAARRGIKITPAGARAPAALDKADAAVTGVEAALAESGTLVLYALPGRERGLSLLPPVHVAVVRARDIVPDLLDAARELRGLPQLPSAVTLITGPSKTADIEGVLVTGVHGPGRLHVIVVPE